MMQSARNLAPVDDQEGEGGETEGKDLDPDALAYIRAKRNVDDLHKAKRQK
jgi:hypothetical protein